MCLETIRDPHSLVMGFIATEEHGDGIAHDAHMKVLGKYSIARNFTYDSQGCPFARGNRLLALIQRSAD
ncbi:hypothetical protein [Cupriavidus consociatus]|uniref:hypothetical protein n=1 Tax=Cupriavidus consociatus TaxID=2821357 RepID=UPI001AE2ADC0|nr:MULTISPECIES: hypothetical protein [unclassified Cupriavidus]MBP0622902.1 hypothetical protein [Cupriavidus sp. LEh25]MDK2659590.1 hypothetical protein [Cupriavidus sp. LEh21]